MNENKIRSYEDEPPNKIQNVKSNDNINRGIKYTMGYIYRLLLWRGTVLHRSGGFMCASSGICGRWLYLVLGTGKYEGQNREGVAKLTR